MTLIVPALVSVPPLTVLRRPRQVERGAGGHRERAGDRAAGPRRRAREAAAAAEIARLQREVGRSDRAVERAVGRHQVRARAGEQRAVIERVVRCVVDRAGLRVERAAVHEVDRVGDADHARGAGALHQRAGVVEGRLNAAGVLDACTALYAERAAVAEHRPIVEQQIARTRPGRGSRCVEVARAHGHGTRTSCVERGAPGDIGGPRPAGGDQPVPRSSSMTLFYGHNTSAVSSRGRWKNSASSRSACHSRSACRRQSTACRC